MGIAALSPTHMPTDGSPWFGLNPILAWSIVASLAACIFTHWLLGEGLFGQAVPRRQVSASRLDKIVEVFSLGHKRPRAYLRLMRVLAVQAKRRGSRYTFNRLHRFLSFTSSMRQGQGEPTVRTGEFRVPPVQPRPLWLRADPSEPRPPCTLSTHPRSRCQRNGFHPREPSRRRRRS